MASTYLKSCLKYTSATVATIFTASMTASTYYRPVPAHNPHNNCTQSNTHSNDRRTEQTFCSPNSPPWNRDHVPLLLQWARGISIGVTTLAIRVLMNTYGRYRIVEDEHYERFLDAAITARRDQQQQSSSSSLALLDSSLSSSSQPRGLLTVSNHRSLFDDPGILSCLLPLPIAIQPHHQRWGICSQEYCFNDALPSYIKGYIGAGQVLPICRGGGINQQLLLDFGRHLANGEWCHVFPEGGVWQWRKELGGRRLLSEGCVLGSASDFADNNNSSSNNNNNSNSSTNSKSVIIPATTAQRSLPPSPIGKLKWGVGKLIAHAPITPRVIPFAHCGMERLLPQDEVSGKTYLRRDFVQSLIPSFLLGNDNGGSDGDGKGLQIQIQFGHEINFDDLIQEHEEKHGKLWKYRGKEPTSIDINTAQGSQPQLQPQPQENWVSSKEERMLYSKIVKRIEMHLEVLTKEVCR